MHASPTTIDKSALGLDENMRRNRPRGGQTDKGSGAPASTVTRAPSQRGHRSLRRTVRVATMTALPIRGGVA